MPGDAVSRTANVERTGWHKWVNSHLAMFACGVNRLRKKIEVNRFELRENKNGMIQTLIFILSQLKPINLYFFSKVYSCIDLIFSLCFLLIFS